MVLHIVIIYFEKCDSEISCNKKIGNEPTLFLLGTLIHYPYIIVIIVYNIFKLKLRFGVQTITQKKLLICKK